MDAADAQPEDDLADLVAAINALLPQLKMKHEDLLDISEVTYATGIPEDLVLAVLRGEVVTSDDLYMSFTSRLEFLRETRRREDGKKYTYDEIGSAVGVTKAMISALFSGQRSPGRSVADSLEDFFDAEPRFLTLSGRRALARALKPAYGSLVTLSGLRGEGVSHLAMRSSIAGMDSKLGSKLQEALVEAFAQAARKPSDPGERELREITERMRAMDPTPRERLMKKIKGLLGQQP
ncbi:helix-turn-helix domain-containing protein [Streptomyces sp. NPDC056549]|uniref:helix-turn-helix domain-containing protein n=1 Tax=Streptomyces sp. NPDC056549 TaxID=3345864 RepID=UPI003699AC35